MVERSYLLKVGAALALAGAFAFAVFTQDNTRFGKALSEYTVDDIKVLQDSYFMRTGEYLEIREGAQLPPTKSGTISSLLGSDVPSNLTVTPYKTPAGTLGYQVMFKTATSVQSVNVGDARERWRTYEYPIEQATSTKDVFGGFFDFLKPVEQLFGANIASTDLNGSSQYWSIDDASQTGLDLTPPLTMCAWISLDAVGGSFNYVIFGKGSATGATRQYRFGIRDNAGSKQMVLQSSSAGSSFDGDTAITSGSAWAASTPYLVCVAVNGTDVKYYLNDAQHGTTQTSAISSYFNSTSPFSIGAENVGVSPAQYFNGQIDDAMIWARELSLAEIQAIYNTPCTFSEGASLVSRWPFDTDATDATASNNDLTAAGSATVGAAPVYTCPEVGGEVIKAGPPGTTIPGSLFINGSAIFN
jgi:hypothetical protein